VRRLKVSRSAVVRWVGQYRHHGREALRKAGPRRPQAEIGRRGVQTIEGASGPGAARYEALLWTCPRLADLIEREIGVRYHPGNVRQVLVNLGWSPQRPAGKARERNEELIQTWRKKV
jgi:transposase